MEELDPRKDPELREIADDELEYSAAPEDEVPFHIPRD